MTREEKLAYQKGYAAGSRGRWPDHKPPSPPDEMLAQVIKAATAMREALDSQLAMFGEDDEFSTKLYPFIDRFDEAMERIGDWLKARADTRRQPA